MRELARRSDKDRRDLFRAAAQQMRVHEAVLEKDFWVCWVLDYLFGESPWSDHMAFKGGTSLSKAFGARQVSAKAAGQSIHEPSDGRFAKSTLPIPGCYWNPALYWGRP